MYENCFQMFKFLSCKVLVISFVFGFLLQILNIYVRPRLYIGDIFCYMYDMLWLA